MEPGEVGCCRGGVSTLGTVTAKLGGGCPGHPRPEEPAALCPMGGTRQGGSPLSVPAELVVVEAGLQAGGHTVGALVALPDPPPALAVLNADGSNACRTRQGGLSTDHCGVRGQSSCCTHGCTHGVRSLLPATTPPIRSTSWMAARMVPPVSTHWSTRRMRRPGRGQRLRLSAQFPVPSARCPCWQHPLPHDGSTPLAHPARWHRCGPPSPSLCPSSQCRAASASVRRGARLCGWPGSLSAARRQRQHLGMGTAQSGPAGMRVRDPALTRVHAHPG